MNEPFILHPTDFSPCSKAAFDMACSLTRDKGCRLVVLHVVIPPLTTLGGAEGLPPAPEEFDLESHRRELATVRSHDPNVVVEHRLAVGVPAEEIAAVARDPNCQMVVLGTHGRTGVMRFLMGSVAEKVVRTVPCPVLTVKQATTEVTS